MTTGPRGMLATRLAWATDVHFDHLDAAGFHDFCHRVATSRPAALLVGGDIANARELDDHLQALRGDALSRAEEYVRRAPPAVRTPYRAHFEAELGWSASDE